MVNLIILVAFILLILVIVWAHYLSRNKADNVDHAIRDKTNKALYVEHKEEIENDFQQGKIDQESYQYLLTELDKSLLQDMEEGQLHQQNVTSSTEVSYWWPSVISVFILVFSFAVYQQLGSYEEITSLPKGVNPQSHAAEQSQQESLARLEQLKAELMENPQDSMRWFNLGQELVILGDFDNALTAYDRAMNIEGEQAELYGAKAQAAYYRDDQQITAEVQAYADKALALDKTDGATNILLGMHAFTTENYQAAIKHWQLVLDAKKNINVAAITEALNEAKRRLGQAPNAAMPPLDNAASDKQVSNLGVKVSVMLSDEIQQKLIDSEDKTVFVYAIPTSGPRIPVAALKLQASDLPKLITLDDNQAMNPQMAISSQASVNIFAVVSQQGTPGIKPGDFKGQLDNIQVQALGEPITLTINTVAQ